MLVAEERSNQQGVRRNAEPSDGRPAPDVRGKTVILVDGAGANENNLALTKTGAGTLILSGANTYSGDTTISAGTLQIGNGGTTGTLGTGAFGIFGSFPMSAPCSCRMPSRTSTTGAIGGVTARL